MQSPCRYHVSHCPDRERVKNHCYAGSADSSAARSDHARVAAVRMISSRGELEAALCLGHPLTGWDFTRAVTAPPARPTAGQRTWEPSDCALWEERDDDLAAGVPVEQAADCGDGLVQSG
jgi:hypothetical protein